jgi:N-acylneuraminate cytidylyltransferase
MNILAVVPARMGSRRIPRKNLCEIEPGISLVQHAIDCALGAGLTDIVVSTDDPAIPVRGAGVRIRPPDLCTADADISAAILDAWHTAGRRHQLVVTLQPAVLARSPLIVRTLVEHCAAECCCGVTMAHTVPWHWRVGEQGQADPPWLGRAGCVYPRSQDSPDCWAEINACQVSTADAVNLGVRWYGTLALASLPSWAVALDIDEPGDLATARTMWPWAKHQLETWRPTIHRIATEVTP